jgi:acetylornithine deacetylase/succinyl-diaminopimelate desuccinylase-like protein
MTRDERLAIYGATGYTGRQVVREARRRGYEAVLVGRDGSRLETLAAEVPGSEIRVATLGDSRALRAAFAGCGAVINAAGPFARSAEPVVAAAIDSGAHYVDFAGEQEPLLTLFERWDGPARDAEVAVVPAMGFFGALGDLLASITASGLECVEEVTLAYAVQGWLPTEGSRATAAEMAARRRAWRDGRLELVAGDPRFTTFDYPAPLGSSAVLEDYPLPEAVTVPRHIDTPSVRTLMTSSTLEEIFSTRAPDPSQVSDDQRASSRFLVVATASDANTERRSSARGRDIYAVTAPIIVEAAARLISSKHAGALAPSEAFDARDFLASLEPHGLELETPAKQAGGIRKGFAGVDVVSLAQELIRLDTSNPPGRERGAIEHLAAVLSHAGVETTIVARDDERPNLVARIAGRGEAPGLMMHGHVDVVPAASQQWDHPPFSGEIVDGVLWGRGAIDMKSAVAQMAVAFIDAHQAAVRGKPPAGDIVFAALSDEEGGSANGARFVIDEHPELLGGVRYAIGEFGAASTEILGRRFYPVQVSEKQSCTLRLSVEGPAGHGSVPVRGGAVARLAQLLQRLDEQRLPVRICAVTRAMLDGIAAGLPAEAAVALRRLLDPATTDETLDAGGPAMAFFDAALHNTVAPTRLHGSSRVDAIPAAASADLDGRIVPGSTPEELIAELRDLCGPDVRIDLLDSQQPAVADPDLSLLPGLAASLREVDPDGVVVPMLLPGVTDGRFFTPLGIQCYGYTPLRLPGDYPLRELIHSPNERVPVDALRFGVEVLKRLLRRYGRNGATTLPPGEANAVA